VLAGYHAEGIPTTAATMASDEFVPPSDVELARELAEAFDIDWQRYDVSGRPTGRIWTESSRRKTDRSVS